MINCGYDITIYQGQESVFPAGTNIDLFFKDFEIVGSNAKVLHHSQRFNSNLTTRVHKSQAPFRPATKFCTVAPSYFKHKYCMCISSHAPSRKNHIQWVISVINQLDAQHFCFTISLFHAFTCFEHMCSSSGGQNCITQAWNNLIVKQKFCASSWLITEINILGCTVSKTSKHIQWVSQISPKLWVF